MKGPIGIIMLLVIAGSHLTAQETPIREYGPKPPATTHTRVVGKAPANKNTQAVAVRAMSANQSDGDSTDLVTPHDSAWVAERLKEMRLRKEDSQRKK